MNSGLPIGTKNHTSEWTFLPQAHLRPQEILETRRIVGNGLIERNEELLAEAETLLDILREYSKEVEDRTRASEWRTRLSRDFRREHLEREIRNFITALRSKTSTPLSLRPSTARERAVISHFHASDDGEERPRTARELISSRNASRSHREDEDTHQAPAERRPQTAEVLSAVASSCGRPSSAEGSTASQNSAGAEGAYERLEGLAGALRQELTLERELLLEDVEFLHACIETEHQRDLGANCPPGEVPTESELLVLKGKLQVELAMVEAESRASTGLSRLPPLPSSQLSQVCLPLGLARLCVRTHACVLEICIYIQALICTRK